MYKRDVTVITICVFEFCSAAISILITEPEKKFTATSFLSRFVSSEGGQQETCLLFLIFLVVLVLINIAMVAWVCLLRRHNQRLKTSYTFSIRELRPHLPAGCQAVQDLNPEANETARYSELSTLHFPSLAPFLSTVKHVEFLLCSSMEAVFQYDQKIFLAK